MLRLNRFLVYLGACLIAGIRLSREWQVNMPVVAGAEGLSLTRSDGWEEYFFMKPVMLLLLGSLLLTVCACEEAGFVDKDKYDKVVQENADLKKQLAQKEEELKNRGIYLTPPDTTDCGLTNVANGTGPTCTAC
jgi:hypothetical protein